MAELILCILNSANGLVVNEVYILQNGKCTNFANDSGKQTIRYFRVVLDDQELVCKLFRLRSSSHRPAVFFLRSLNCFLDMSIGNAVLVFLQFIVEQPLLTINALGLCRQG